MGQEPHTHQMAQLSLSTQNYSLGVVVAILSIYIKLLALRKDQKKKKGKNFREILRGLGRDRVGKDRFPTLGNNLPIPESLQSHLGIPSTHQPWTGMSST